MKFRKAGKIPALILSIALMLTIGPVRSFAAGGDNAAPALAAAETNPKPLIENVSVSPAIVSPDYGSNPPVSTIRFTLNRRAVVNTVLRRDGRNSYVGSDLFHSGSEVLEPGVHEIEWDGKDDNGMIVPRGMYYVLFKAYELDNDHPTGYPEEYWPNVKLTVKDSEYGIPKDTLKKIVTEARFDKPVISPNGDGIQDSVKGSFTLATGVTHLTAYVSDSLGYNVTQPLFTMENAGPGSYTFNWDGRDFAGNSVNNGTYYMNIYIGQGYQYYTGFMPENARVLLTDGNRIEIPQPAQKARVTTDSVLLSVDPTASGYIAVNGEVYTILGYEPATTEPRGAYKILLKDGITAHIPAVDVEITDIAALPSIWGETVKSNVYVRRGPTSDYEVTDRLPAGTKLRILRQDGEFYRVVLPSGRQAFINTDDLKEEQGSAEPETAIKDINSGSDYARASILDLAARSIVSGDERGNFNPHRNISRSEMIKVLVIALGIDTSNIPEEPDFMDVPKNNWAYKYVEAAYREGIVKGVAPGLYGADKTCTREEMAAMFVRALGITADKLDGKLDLEHVSALDDKNSISEWAGNYVEFAIASGLMKGSGSGTFTAKGSAERQQAAVVIDRFLDNRESILELAKVYQ